MRKERNENLKKVRWFFVFW